MADLSKEVPKKISKEIPAEIREYLNKAEDAFKKHNYDYAIELYTHALEIDGSINEIRHYLHIAKIKKMKENPPNVLTKGMKLAKGQTMALNARKLETQGKIKEAVKEYEKSLSADPMNAGTYCRMGDLFVELEDSEAAIMTFQEALLVDPDEVKALKELGRLLKEKEEFDKARQYYSHAQKLAPTDMDITQGLKDLSALQTIDKGGWQQQDTFRDKIADKDKAAELEIETRKTKSAEDVDYLINQTKKQLEAEPENVSLLFRLADNYKTKKDWGEAIKTYNRILELKPENDVALKNIDDINIKKMEADLINLQEALKKDPENEEVKAKIQDIENKKELIHFERVKDQVAKLPNDLALRFKYGLMLRQKGMLNEAISQFQEVVKDPSRRLDALNMLGECFMKKKMFDIAITQFEKAMNLNSDINNKTKAIIYNLGLAYEEMNKPDEAVKQFKKIYEVDISYKDVAKKIEEAYKG
jgi:tetratricopeptide (TPR) repeat protein